MASAVPAAATTRIAGSRRLRALYQANMLKFRNQLEWRAHARDGFPALLDPLLDHFAPRSRQLQILDLLRIDSHNAACRRVDRGQVAAHHQNAARFRTALDR